MNADISSIDDLQAALDVVDAHRTSAVRHPRYAFDRPWGEFVRIMRLLTPQSYGARIQRWVQEFYDWSAVPAGSDAGDCVDSDGNRIEVKVSIITNSNPAVNWVQLRPYQRVDCHCLFVIDRSFTLHRFDLDPQQLETELTRAGENAHGTASAASENVNREYALRFNWDDTQKRSLWDRYRSSAPLPNVATLLGEVPTGETPLPQPVSSR